MLLAHGNFRVTTTVRLAQSCMDRATDQYEQRASSCLNLALGSLLEHSIDITTERACSAVSWVSYSHFTVWGRDSLSLYICAIRGAIGLHNTCH